MNLQCLNQYPAAQRSHLSCGFILESGGQLNDLANISLFINTKRKKLLHCYQISTTCLHSLDICLDCDCLVDS